MNITASVIAGGKSKRFGQDKLLYKFKGKPLIEYVISVLNPLFNDIIIISKENEKFSYLNIPVYPDIIPDLGPIGGIYTALSHSETDYIFCFAGDMPNLNPEFIKYMISVSADFDIVAPYYNDNYEALHSIYSKNCLPLLKERIGSGDYKVINIYKDAALRQVKKEEIEKFSNLELLFKNINYIDDLE